MGQYGIAREAPLEALGEEQTLVGLPARLRRLGMFYVGNDLALLLAIGRAAASDVKKCCLVQQISAEHIS